VVEPNSSLDLAVRELFDKTDRRKYAAGSVFETGKMAAGKSEW
jgi:hypothetical protein